MADEVAAPSNAGRNSSGVKPRVPFDTGAYWSTEDMLTVDDRRERYPGTSLVTLDDITTWADHADTIPTLSDKDDLIKKLKKRFAKHDAANSKMVALLAENEDDSLEMAHLRSFDWTDEDLACSFADEKFDYKPDEEINKKVSLYIGDITTLEIDAIVNAANTAMRGGGGIDGRIHSVAGPSLLEECIELRGCKTGYTKATRGHLLPCRYILHTVGPKVQRDSHPLPQTSLMNCYTTCLDWVVNLGLRSVAFCCISTGIFSYPLDAATHAALKITREWIQKDDNRNKIDRIIFCVYGMPEWDMYEKLMQVYYPPIPQSPHLKLPTKKHSAPVNKVFLKPIDSTNELIAAIKQAHKEAEDSPDPQIDLAGLEQLIESLDKKQRGHFFGKTLPKILDLNNRRREILEGWDKSILPQAGARSSTINAEQIACLLASAFLTIIPDQAFHHQKFNSFSFGGLWQAFGSKTDDSESSSSTEDAKSSSKSDDPAVLERTKSNAMARFHSILNYFDQDHDATRTLTFERQVVPPNKTRGDWTQIDHNLPAVHEVADHICTVTKSKTILAPVLHEINPDAFNHTALLSRTDALFWSCPEMLYLSLVASRLLPHEIFHIKGLKAYSNMEFDAKKGTLSFQGPFTTSDLGTVILVPQQRPNVASHMRLRWYLDQEVYRVFGALRSIEAPYKIAIQHFSANPALGLDSSLNDFLVALALMQFETLALGEVFKDKKKLVERQQSCPELFVYGKDVLGLSNAVRVLTEQAVRHDHLIVALSGKSLLKAPLYGNGTLAEQVLQRFANWKKEWKEYVKLREKEIRQREKQTAKEQQAKREAFKKQMKEREKAAKQEKKAQTGPVSSTASDSGKTTEGDEVKRSESYSSEFWGQEKAKSNGAQKPLRRLSKSPKPVPKPQASDDTTEDS